MWYPQSDLLFRIPPNSCSLYRLPNRCATDGGYRYLVELYHQLIGRFTQDWWIILGPVKKRVCIGYNMSINHKPLFSTMNGSH